MSSYLLTLPAKEGLSTLHHCTDSWIKYGSRPGFKNTATSSLFSFLCIVIHVQYKIIVTQYLLLHLHRKDWFI